MEKVKSLVQIQFLRQILIVFGASLLLALCAPISFRLPFSPIPLAISAQVLIGLSVILGSQRATFATLLYLSYGLMGFPVFAGGNSGITYFFGPTGGFLVGFVITAFVVGNLCEKLKERKESNTFLIMMLGNSIVYLFGLPYLSLYIGWEKAIQVGCFPFIAADLLKLILCFRVLKAFKTF